MLIFNLESLDLDWRRADVYADLSAADDYYNRAIPKIKAKEAEAVKDYGSLVKRRT
jgi:hypothetical protein